MRGEADTQGSGKGQDWPTLIAEDRRTCKEAASTVSSGGLG